MSKRNDKLDDVDWLNPNDWNIRKNTKRKNADANFHPSVEVGRKGTKIANIGLTHSEKRGHHRNKKLSRNPNPKDSKASYVRDDIRLDDNKYLKEILKDFRKLPDEDIRLILDIINKHKKKK